MEVKVNYLPGDFLANETSRLQRAFRPEATLCELSKMFQTEVVANGPTIEEVIDGIRKQERYRAIVDFLTCYDDFKGIYEEEIIRRMVLNMPILQIVEECLQVSRNMKKEDFPF